MTAKFHAGKLALVLCSLLLSACSVSKVAGRLGGSHPDQASQSFLESRQSPAPKFPSPADAAQKFNALSLRANESPESNRRPGNAAKQSNYRTESADDRSRTLLAEASNDDTKLVQPAQFLRPLNAAEVNDEVRERDNAVRSENGSDVESAPTPEQLPVPAVPRTGTTTHDERYPIDLATALALAGGNNLQIAFAAERVQAAMARVDQADVLWVPSLNAGLIYNNHAGRIQATEGDVVEVSRNSLFVGAGAGLGNAPLNGGSGGPARMVVDLPLVDVLFEPLAQRQALHATEAEEAVAFNNTLLQVAVAYLDLLQAAFRADIAQEAVDNAEKLVKITEDFAREGEGLEADAQRAKAELEERRRALLKTKEAVAVTSAELARLLRLDPAVTLVPTDRQPVAVDLIPTDFSLHDLIGQAMSLRPEAASLDARVEETWLRMRQEHLRPWLPHLYAGFSAGGFGGAPGSSVSSFSDRTDFDLAAVWELENLGLGNGARRREQESIHFQAHIAAEQVRDLIASEVSRSYHQVHYRGEQIISARSQVEAARRSLELSLDGIRNKVLRPIEAQQAITALAAARQRYVESIIDFNRAQFELLRAIGQPPAAEAHNTAAP